MGPATLELGPEPPAVVNFITHGFEVTPDAAAATLLDLGARNVVEFEHRGPDAFVLRLGGDPGGLSPYEERVLALLRKNVSGGVVPPEALTTGRAGDSSAWWKAFSRDVVSDAEERGLSRPILDGKLFARLFVASCAPGVLFGVRFDSKVGFGVVIAALALLSFVQSRHTQRETAAGLAAASHWLGLRAKLSEDEVFPTLSPIAVETWERHLAYGAALGLAPAAVGPISMGPESDKYAWSSYGGRWRLVRIVYPQRLSWGSRPVWALLRAVAREAVAGLVFYLLAVPLFDRFSGFHGWEWLAALLLLPPAIVAAEAAVVLLASAADMASARETTGEILRLRTLGGEQKKLRHYVALDEGRSATIRAWIVRPELYRGLEQHQVVTASVTPHLRYVRSITAAGPG